MDTASSSEAEGGGGRRRLRWGVLAAWLLGAAALTLALWPFRERLPTAHAALAYLLLVLVGSARQGRTVGLLLSVACFLGFNYFLLPPYYTFALRDPLNWWVLVAFLVTGAVAAELFHGAQHALEESRSRARVLDRLAALGAESLAVAGPVEGVRAIARVAAAELGVESCTIVGRDAAAGPVELGSSEPSVHAPDAQLVEIAAREGRPTGVRADGSLHLGPAGAPTAELAGTMRELVTLALPLRVRDRVVGVVVLEDRQGIRLDGERARFADALVSWAALAVERARLAADSEHVEALREADRAKDAVLASVSHDLRTPLTTIRALAAELRAGGEGRAAVIEEEADRLNRMVADLLDLSRIRAGAVPLEPRIIAAEDLVGAVLQRVAGVPGVDRIDVRLPGGDALLTGRFDFVQALRALANLVENGLRHSPAERRVGIEVAEEEGELVFRVLDRGPGVSEADRDRIFEPFVRGEGGDRPRAGIGLGLPIARSLAEAQGGSVRLRPRPGGGSVFELRLPAASVEDIP